jgi:hypothetical protein
LFIAGAAAGRDALLIHANLILAGAILGIYARGAFCIGRIKNSLLTAASPKQANTYEDKSVSLNATTHLVVKPNRTKTIGQFGVTRFRPQDGRELEHLLTDSWIGTNYSPQAM